MFRRSIRLLSNNQSTKIVFNALEGNYALCLLGKQLRGVLTEGCINRDVF